jgi:hypothetical protein|tara:strand:- start:3818 stop:4141 length:324 start_codon:yes stop_codon:yes gene_type:complete
MFAVIRHTFEMINPEPDNPKSYKIHSDWKHYVWLFEEEVDAMAFAITLLDSPLLQANEHYLDHAIESLETNRFWQTGRESVAVAEVVDSPEIIYGDPRNERGKDNIH